MPQNGLKMGSFYPFVHSKWSRMRLVPKQPISRHFGIFGGPKRANTSSKRSKNTCFGAAHGLGSFLRKVIFLPLMDPGDPFGQPTCLGLSLQLAAA